MGKPELFGDGLEGLSHAPLLEETHQGLWLTSSSPISTTSDPELGRCPVNPQGVGCQDEKKLRGHLIRPLQCRDPPPPALPPPPGVSVELLDVSRHGELTASKGVSEHVRQLH